MQPSVDPYKIIAEYAVDPIFILNTGEHIVYANPAAERLLGYTAAELSGLGFTELTNDGPQGAATVPAQHASHDRPAGENVRTFLCKDGSSITLSGISKPIVSDGAYIGTIIFARDITRQSAAECALAASEQRFRLVTQSIPQAVWMLAPDGTVTFVNQRFEQLTGRSVGIGADYVTPVHPDDVPRTQQALQKAVQSGEDYRIEHRVRVADGSYHWFLSHGVPFKDEHGNILAWYGSSTDIDDIRRTSDALRKSEQTLHLAVESAGLGLWDFYPDTGELLWNMQNRAIFGIPAEVPVTQELFMSCIEPEDRQRVDAMTQEVMHSDGHLRFEIECRIMRHDDGRSRWLRMYGKSVRDSAGHPVRFIGTTLDITDSKLAEQRVREASLRDTLTGLPNRALLFEYCQHLLAIARRTKSTGALLFIDLDRFKPINDTHGHDIGDQVLKQVARRLQSCTRQEDVVGRLGGDEFVVALPHPDDIHGPATVAQHIIERVSAPYQIGALQISLSPSIGISLYPRHADNLDALIKCADTAMYEAKRSGAGRYRFYTSALESGIDPHAAIEMQLRQALDNNTLVLHYQPVLDIESGLPVGVEALLRLPMPDGEPLLPHQFLHIAEAAGLTNRIGEWVAREACRQHQQWRHAGLPHMSIAINVAPQQFRQRSFVSYLASSVHDSGMDPSCLQIELKESTVLEDVQDTISALEEIRSLGIRVALDDFGVGYSSIGLLSSLPIDKLKIDQSFVSRIGQDTKSQTITDTVLALGRTLNLQVVGEGIESEEVFDYLREQGCDQAQGYYFSKPLSADAFENWYRDLHGPVVALH